jgi:hypothetical protein
MRKILLALPPLSLNSLYVRTSTPMGVFPHICTIFYGESVLEIFASFDLDKYVRICSIHTMALLTIEKNSETKF